MVPLHLACRLLGILLVVQGLALVAPLARVTANGTPINVVLQYLSGVSNWGPTNASGVAEIITGEGEVRLSTTGLPRLSGERYQFWIMDTAGNNQLPIGAFNANADGVGRLDLVLERPIPDGNWNQLLVSVEPDGSRPATPSARRAIVGRIAESGPGAGGARPAELPRTGGDSGALPPSGSPVPAALLVAGAVLVLVLGGAIGFGIGRRGASRETE